MAALFDESFERRLVRVIEVGAIPSSVSGTLSERANEVIIKWDGLRRFVYEFSRVSLRIMCELVRVDIMSKSSDQSSVSTRVSFWRRRGAKHSTTIRATRRWPQVLLTVYILSAIMISINTYYSYIHHANMLKLYKLEEHIGSRRNVSQHALSDGKLRELGRRFELQARNSRRQLETLGTNHLTWTFVSESIVLLFVSISIIAYLVMPLLSSIAGCQLLAAGGLIDRRRECELRAKLIIVELKRFSLSSESFSTFGQVGRQLAASCKLEARAKQHSAHPIDWSSASPESFVAVDKLAGLHLYELHWDTLKLLADMALEGRLNPLGRTRAARDRQAIFFIGCSLFMLAFMQSSMIAVYLFLNSILNGQANQRERGPLDWLDAFNLIFMCEISANVALVIMVTFALTIYEQFQSVTNLRQLIWDLIQRTRNGPPIDSEELELSLLTVITQNRILVRSFGLARKPLSMIAMILIYFCLSQPLIFKLHSAYFNARVRWASSLWGVAAVGCTLVYIYALGLLHQSYIKTFRLLWSLVAQQSHAAIQRAQEKFRSAPPQESLAAFTIRRELFDEQEAVNKFACRLASIPITNTNIIKIAFYSLLILISLSSDYNVLGDGLTRLMSDPFNLYDFLSGS